MAWTRKSSRSQLSREPREHGVDACHVGDVAIAGDFGAELGSQRLDPLAESVALIGQRELGALAGQRLGDTPGDRTVVGDAHDEAALAGHQALSTSHVDNSPHRFLSDGYRTGDFAPSSGTGGRSETASAPAAVPRGRR